MKPGLLVTVVKKLLMAVNSVLIVSHAIIFASVSGATRKTKITCINLTEQRFHCRIDHQKILKSFSKKPTCCVTRVETV